MGADAVALIPFGPWSCCARPPGAVSHPEQLPADEQAWISAPVPGTVASALHAAGRWQFGQPLDLDAEDWWYRTTFPAPDCVRAIRACCVSTAWRRSPRSG